MAGRILKWPPRFPASGVHALCNPLSLSVGETHEYHQWYSYDQVKLYGKGEGNFANVIKRLNQLGSVQSLSQVQVFANPQTAARQASLSITNSWSLLRLMSIKSVIPSNHLILCYPLLLPPSIFPSIRVISNESALRIRWPKYWSFSFSISPSNEDPGLISFWMDWLDLLEVQGTLKSLLQHQSSKASLQKHQMQKHLQCSAF